MGTVLNPLFHQGQIEGGVIQGLGYALMEEMETEEGRISNLSLGDYKIPTIKDIPELVTVLLEPAGGPAPFDSKGIGESSNTPVAGAIANAVSDAIGVPLTQLPITAERVLLAIKGRGVGELMHLTRLGLAWVPPFTEPPIDLRFNEYVNVLIGPNASGKSTILQLLAEHLGAWFEDSKRSLGDATFHTSQVYDAEFDEFLEYMTGPGSSGVLSVSEDWTSKLPVVHIGSVREGVRGILDQPAWDEYGRTSEECLNGPFSGFQDHVRS